MSTGRSSSTYAVGGCSASVLAAKRIKPPMRHAAVAHPLLTTAAPIVYGGSLLAEGVHFAFAGEDL